MVLAALLSAAALAIVNPYVRGDGNGYYAWAASAVVDGDLQFANQYAHADPLFRERYLDAHGQPLPERMTPTGHLDDQWAVGPAVLWAPFVAIAHVAAKIAGSDPGDGFAPLYRRLAASATVLYALAALWLSVRAARTFGATAEAALLAAIAVACATPLIVYACVLPFHVHALAAFTVAWFLWYGLTRPLSHRAKWLAWGGLAGLMAMTYHVDAVLALVAIPAAFRGDGLRGDAVQTVAWRTAAARLMLFGVAAAGVALPQWIGKAVVYGWPLTTGYQDTFSFLRPRLLAVLFSPDHGVILWTPIVAIGVAGLWRVRGRADARWWLAAIGVFYYVIASYQNWNGLSSFGNRFFVSLTLPLVVGVASVVSAAATRGAAARTLAVLTLAGLVVWNGGLVVQWGSKMLPNRGPVDVRQATRQQLDVPGRIGSLVYRYFTSREALIKDIEAKDRAEWQQRNPE